MPKPKKVIVTRWGDDEYAYGSYSHIQVGASGRDYHTLEQPVNHRLYFAGARSRSLARSPRRAQPSLVGLLLPRPAS